MRFRHKLAIGVGAGLVVGAGIVLNAPGHIAPANLYPNSSLSPGLAQTQDIGLLTQTNPTYSQSHRKTTEFMKEAVRKEYPNCPREQEIDHIIPLAIGGADDVKNLWCQPEHLYWDPTQTGKYGVASPSIDYGYHTKDVLEAYLAIQVKARTISPRDAQSCILKDWVACYIKYIKPNTFGAVNATDPDDDDF